jgi:hypothetical protein
VGRRPNSHPARRTPNGHQRGKNRTVRRRVFKRLHVLRERSRATEAGVDVVDLLDGKHDGCGLRYPIIMVGPCPRGVRRWNG